MRYFAQIQDNGWVGSVIKSDRVPDFQNQVELTADSVDVSGCFYINGVFYGNKTVVDMSKVIDGVTVIG